MRVGASEAFCTILMCAFIIFVTMFWAIFSEAVGAEKIVGMNSDEIPVFADADLSEMQEYLIIDDFREINVLKVDGYAVQFEFNNKVLWTVKGFFLFEGGEKNCLERNDNRAGSRGLTSGC